MTGPQTPAPRSVPGRGIRLLAVRGVPIYLSPISLIFLVFLAASFQPRVRDRVTEITNGQAYGLAAVMGLMTLVWIVLHELGHALTAQSLQFEVDAITVYGFVGVTEFHPEPQTPWRSFVVSVSGPLVNLVIGIPFWAWYVYGSVDPNSALGVLIWSVAWVNVALGVFNLLPGLPLDGGSVFASGVWKVTGDRGASVRAAAYSGFVVAGALAVWGLSRSSNGGAGYTLGIALLLALGAGSSLKRTRVVEQLPSVVAGQVARRAVTVEANLPLSEALRRADTLGVKAIIVADSSNRPWALMNGAAADAVPDVRRPWTTINQVSRPIEEGMRIPESMAGRELLERLSTNPASEYLVTDATGTPTGVLVMVDVVARIDPPAAARMHPPR